MALTTLVSKASLAAGVRTVERAIPLGITQAELTFDVTDLDNETGKIGLSVLVSQDGGTTWASGGSAEADLSLAPVRFKSDEPGRDTRAGLTVGLLRPDNAERRARVSLELSTAMTLDFAIEVT